MKRDLEHLVNSSSFFKTTNSEPIDFASRYPPNLQHDMLYLTSYIHDAKFSIARVRLRDRILRIPMDRDRWELGTGVGFLDVISTVLTIQPVTSISWKLKGPHIKKGQRPKSNRFIIGALYFGESFWNSTENDEEGNNLFELVLKDHWRSQLRIKVPDTFSFRLTDIPVDDPGHHSTLAH